jgi:hypothetical protein
MKFAYLFAAVALVASADAKKAFKHGMKVNNPDAARAQQDSDTGVGHDFAEKCTDPTHMEVINGEQKCVAPSPDESGNCPRPFVLKGQAPYFDLRTEHFELRKLSWDEMVSMPSTELEQFLRKHDVPFTVRTKVLKMHEEKGGEKVCVPSQPFCLDPLEYNSATNECQEPIPKFGNPVLNDAWISPVEKAVEEQKGVNAWEEKASHEHAPVATDPNDVVMQKARQNQEKDLWNWEVNKNSFAH